MKKQLNKLAVLFGSLAGIIGTSYYYFVRRPLPPKKGVKHIDGIQNSIEIIRDDWGVPHIYAENENDLFFAQGYVHAQDRLWQMDFNRRFASGTTAEIFGKDSLPLDRWMRTLGLRYVAEKEIHLLDSQAKNALDSYAKGINSRIKEGRFPIEFTLLGYKPEEWKISDSLSWAKMMAWSLSVNWESEILRAKIINLIGPEKAADLENLHLPVHPIVIPDEIDYSNIGSEALNRVQEARKSTGGEALENLGSNNWVISGNRSSTGKPILANDMHLGMTAPSIWYENHLIGGSLNLSGITFPGIPGILSGHNGHVAWGYTNGFPDVQDLFIEHIKTNDENEVFYEYKNEWLKANTRYEKIRIKGQKSISERIVTTHHGPIINLLAPELIGEEPLALQWTALEPGDMFNGLLKMIRARNCTDFKDALRFWNVPSQNTVYADIDSDYYYTLTGKIPIRAKGDGRIPVPGWTGEYEWIGYIPFDELPHLENPKQGYIYSANNRVVNDTYPYWLGYDHCAGNRARRIQELIEANENINIDYIMKMQNDLVSIAARDFVEAINKMNFESSEIDQILSRLKIWDGKLTASSSEATVYEVSIHYLLKNILQANLGDLTSYYLGKGPTPVIGEISILGERSREWLQNIIKDPHKSAWFDSANGNCAEEVILTSIKQAVNYLKNNFGPDMDNWAWGKFHTLTFNHVLGSKKPLDILFNRGPYGIGGDSDTIWNTSSSYHNNSGKATTSAPFRFIADLSNFDNSLGCLVPGQSGHPFSDHYSDNVEDWFEGKYHPMLYSRVSVEKHRTSTFWLEPNF